MRSVARWWLIGAGRSLFPSGSLPMIKGLYARVISLAIPESGDFCPWSRIGAEIVVVCVKEKSVVGAFGEGRLDAKEAWTSTCVSRRRSAPLSATRSGIHLAGSHTHVTAETGILSLKILGRAS